MNIFIFSLDHAENARFHCDRHVVKMCIEYAQLLSTACRLNGIAEGYKATHAKHPCSIWVQLSTHNWHWLMDLLRALNHEYRFRYEKKQNHRSYDVAAGLTCPGLAESGLTPFAQVMPDQYRQDNTVEAYRDYFVGEKQPIARWTKRNAPPWFAIQRKQNETL